MKHVLAMHFLAVDCLDLEACVSQRDPSQVGIRPTERNGLKYHARNCIPLCFPPGKIAYSLSIPLRMRL